MTVRVLERTQWSCNVGNVYRRSNVLTKPSHGLVRSNCVGLGVQSSRTSSKNDARCSPANLTGNSVMPWQTTMYYYQEAPSLLAIPYLYAYIHTNSNLTAASSLSGAP